MASSYDRTKDQSRHTNEVTSAPATIVVPGDAQKSDTVDLAVYAKNVYVGVAGDVAVIPKGNADDKPVTYKNVPAGSFLHCQVRRILATGTTATALLLEIQ